MRQIDLLEIDTWLSQVLHERFGLDFQIEFNEAENSRMMSLPGLSGCVVFHEIDSSLYSPGLPGQQFRCEWWPVQKEFVSILDERFLPLAGSLALKENLIVKTDYGASIQHDILGFIYWLMNRLEEVDCENLDEHQRFTSFESHAYKNGYLERPVVDEWLDILGQVIKIVWPNVALLRKDFNIKLSHDVDRPSRYGFSPLNRVVKMMAGDIFKRGDFLSALRGGASIFRSAQRLSDYDPYNTFDWIMDQSEENGLISSFYFICGRTEASKDADYNIEDGAIRNLMSRIHERGHEIGLHPSYNTYNHPPALKEEADRLRSVMEEEGIQQEILGGRMHYLRWRHPTTLQSWNAAGMTYDSSLGYADRPGFRCGTCHEFPAFDPVERKILALRIRPLIVMERAVIAEKYLGLGVTDLAKEKMISLKGKCEKVCGSFTLLWHNSELKGSAAKTLYKNLL